MITMIVMMEGKSHAAEAVNLELGLFLALVYETAFLDEIALAQAISPIATRFSVARSVCLSSVTFVHPA